MFSLSRLTCAIALLMVFFVDSVTPALGPQDNEVVGVELGMPNVCKLEVRGVPIKTARVYGRKTDLIKFFDKVLLGQTLLSCTSCPCLLVNSSNRGRCLFNTAPKLALAGSTGGAPPNPPNRIKIEFNDGEDFVKFYDKSRDSACKPAGKLCINTGGEVSFSLGCEDQFEIEASTKGNVNMSVTSGGRTTSVPLIKQN